jgi:transcription elongation factor Elf1
VTEHPKFTCRREGHQPQVTVDNKAGVVASYLTVCMRCGKWLEVSLEPEESRVDASAPD